MDYVLISNESVVCAICMDDMAPGSIGIGCRLCFQSASQYPTITHQDCWDMWEPGTCLLCRTVLYRQYDADEEGIDNKLLAVCIFSLMFTPVCSFNIMEPDAEHLPWLATALSFFPVCAFCLPTIWKLHPCYGITVLSVWCLCLTYWADMERSYFLFLLLALILTLALLTAVDGRSHNCATVSAGLLAFWLVDNAPLS